MRFPGISGLLVFLVFLGGCGEGPDDLRFEKLTDRPELWPLEMELTAEHEADYLGETETLGAGVPVGVSEVYPDVLVAWNAERGRAFNVPPEKTDIVERAREIWRGGIPEEGRVSRDLGAHLRSVGADGKLSPLPPDRLEGKEIIVFYYADSYDDDCFLLAEGLNKRYEKFRRENPDFEMILISRDPVEWRFRRFLELLPPSFPVLAYGERRRRPTVL